MNPGRSTLGYLFYFTSLIIITGFVPFLLRDGGLDFLEAGDYQFNSKGPGREREASAIQSAYCPWNTRCLAPGL
jgi:hypothetical protein